MARGYKRQRGDAWELWISAGFDPVTGRRRRVTRTFRGSAAAADREITRLLGELDQGAHRGPDAALTTLLDRWWAHSKHRWGPATTRGYLTYRRTYLDADLLHTRSAATVRKVHVMLHDALADAVRWGWLAWNPADRAQPPPVRRRPLVVPDRQLLGAAVAAVLEVDPDYAALLRLQVVAGLRRAELAGLRWEDLADGAVTIRRTVVEAPDRRLEVQADTKSHRARRIILDPATLVVLEDHRLRWKDRCADLGIDPGGYIFPRLADPSEHMTPGQISQRWRRTRARVGLDGVRLHDFRHAMVTWLLDQGIPVHDVAARAGHANGNVTLAIYAHPTTEGARRAGDVAGS
jgi:integrase